MSDTPFRKASTDTAFSVSAVPAAAVTNTLLPYKLTGQSGRNPTADLAGDNEIIVGFPASVSSLGEAVRFDRGGLFVTIAKGAGCNVNVPFTAAVGGVRVAVFGTDHIQGYFTTTAAADAQVQVRLLA